ncbi:MAG: hypothetical protein PHY02_06550 [Phycisphaerae bacterium]|nr:hypothetical protein [Phycisphaerae bacterium]
MSKPKGWGNFDKLARTVAVVPKEQVENKIKTEQAARRKHRRKK